MIPEIDIWRANTLMLKRYGDKAFEESAARADELAAQGRLQRPGVWRRITEADALVFGALLIGDTTGFAKAAFADGKLGAALPNASADMSVDDAETELPVGRATGLCQWLDWVSKQNRQIFTGFSCSL